MGSMPSSRADVVRRALKARRSEFEELLDPDVRLDLSARVFNPEVYEGYEGVLRWRRDVADVWDSYVSEPEEFIDVGDAVLVLTRERGRGLGSGVEIERRTALLCRLRNGRVSEVRLYNDPDQALEDLGSAG
jgi:ketosteroid isomerase-like protein